MEVFIKSKTHLAGKSLVNDLRTKSNLLFVVMNSLWETVSPMTVKVMLTLTHNGKAKLTVTIDASKLIVVILVLARMGKKQTPDS